MSNIFYILRAPSGGDPGGVTVSKRAKLRNEFRITEYRWGEVSLWFIEEDEFTDNERQYAYEAFARRQITAVRNPNRPKRKSDE